MWLNFCYNSENSQDDKRKSKDKIIDIIHKESLAKTDYSTHLNRESSNDDMEGVEYESDFTDREISNKLKAYLSGPIEDCHKNIDLLLKAFKIHFNKGFEEEKDWQIEKEIDTTVNSHNLESITKGITNIVNNENLIKQFEELNLLKIDNLLLMQDINRFQETEELFSKYSKGLQDLYLKAKTEWWAHRLEVKIDSFKDAKFSLRVKYKDKIDFKIHLKSKGK